MNNPPANDHRVDDRITLLEEKVAFQQRMLDDINTVVVGQQAKLDELHREISRLIETSRLLIERSGDDLPHEKPPHY